MKRTIAEDLIENGLPAWVMSWKTILLAVLVVPLGFTVSMMIVSQVRHTFLPPSHHAPACFTIGYLQPLKAGNGSGARFNSYVVKHHAVRASNLERLDNAAKGCRLDSCAEEAKEFFKESALKYMTQRGEVMQNFYLWYGARGLDHAIAIYSGEEDEKAIELIRQHFSAGHVDIRLLRGKEDVVRMMLFKPISELRLCTRK